VTAFARFPSRLQEAIVSRLAWTSSRPVQELVGEAILEGKNAVVLAPTAGGKTEASMFPALANLIEDEPEGVGVIYVAPIKALLNNQEERLGNYAEMVGLRRFRHRLYGSRKPLLETRRKEKDASFHVRRGPERSDIGSAARMEAVDYRPRGRCHRGGRRLCDRLCAWVLDGVRHGQVSDDLRAAPRIRCHRCRRQRGTPCEQ